MKKSVRQSLKAYNKAFNEAYKAEYKQAKGRKARSALSQQAALEYISGLEQFNLSRLGLRNPMVATSSFGGVWMPPSLAQRFSKRKRNAAQLEFAVAVLAYVVGRLMRERQPV